MAQNWFFLLKEYVEIFWLLKNTFKPYFIPKNIVVIIAIGFICVAWLVATAYIRITTFIPIFFRNKTVNGKSFYNNTWP